VKYGGEAQWIGLSVRRGTRDEVHISVSDRGLGIAAAELDKIFEPFYRSRIVAAANIHGTGLGLSVARTMTESMQGTLTVVSEVGKGSTFTVTLPAEAAPAEPISPVESKVGTDHA
jgi:signal transduction histidine kinase